MTRAAHQPHDGVMQLSSTLSWLVDAAAETAGANRLLADLGHHLITDGLPLAGGALTLEVPHPLIARRTWLWRAGNGEVIEALGFAPEQPFCDARYGRIRRCRPALAQRPRTRPDPRGHDWNAAGWPDPRLDRDPRLHAGRQLDVR